MHLNAQRGDLASHIGSIGLGKRRQQVQPLLRPGKPQLRAVDLPCRIVDERPGGLRQRLHTDQHPPNIGRSEEHTSELQSLMRISYAVFCLKKKKKKPKTYNHTYYQPIKRTTR